MYLASIFRGSWITTVSDKGALSIPRNLRKRAGGHLGSVFITSVTGDCGRIYSMRTWQTIKEKLDKLSDANLAKQKFALRTDYYGAEQTLGPNGLQLIDAVRESAGLKRHVILVGSGDYLEVYSLPLLNEKVRSGRLEFKDLAPLAEIDPNLRANRVLLAGIDLSQRRELSKLLASCRREVTRYVATHTEKVFDLKPRVFEFVLAEILESCGYEVELTAQTRDGGVDLFAVRRDVLGISTRYVIECKRWSKARKVTVELVRALYGAKEAHRADQAIFVTSSRFTSDSWKLCTTGQLRNMTLVDFEKLQEWFAVYLNAAKAHSG